MSLTNDSHGSHVDVQLRVHLALIIFLRFELSELKKDVDTS